MPLLKRDPGRSAAPVAESWKRIEAWLKEHCESLFEALRPGVATADIERLEQAIGLSLPEDVKESYRIHDAHKGTDDEVGDLFFCNLPLVGRGGSVLKEWQSWDELRRTSPDVVEQPEAYGKHTSVPEGYIRPVYTLQGWVPLQTDYGMNYIGVDLNPEPKGRVGQVISFGRDRSTKTLLAHSWAQFLEDIADEMEAGNFYLEEYESIWLRAPKQGPLYMQYREWHEAKVGT